METEYVRCPVEEPDEDAIRRGGEIIRAGGLVAFPTETVYGLGGDAFNPDSSRKIYAAKGRPSDNPLIVHIAATDALKEVAKEIPDSAYKLAEAFWPGPLTMILQKQPALPRETTGGLDTVAIRFPDHPVALALIRQAGGFVAAPSANTSGRPSPTVGKYVYEDLEGRIEMLLDAGQVGIGVESTIVDLTVDVPTVLRPGYVTMEMLEKVLPEIRLDPALISGNETARPKAPGMKYKHYAPRGEVVVVEGSFEKVSECLLNEVSRKKQEGIKTGLIITDEMADRLRPEWEKNRDAAADSVKCMGHEGDEEQAAHTLFQYLREFDEEGVGYILAQALPETGLGLAVMNRLKKAAGGNIIRV